MKNDNKGLLTRKAAVRILMAATLKHRPLDITLDEISREAALDSRERAFVLNLVMLSLRRYGSLKSLLGTLLSKGLPRNATWTEAALLTGLAQILLMHTSDHAAVHETVELVKTLSGKEQGFSGLVNAVLRRAAREKKALLAKLNAMPEKDLPDWVSKSWQKAYGAEALRGIAESLQSSPPLDISVKNPTEREAWAEKLEAESLPTGTLRRAFADVTTLPGYEEGAWWVQDMAAAIPATLLGDVSGKHVLDLCAAPGGKTMQLAAMGAKVTSVDRSKNRLKRLEANLKRTGQQADVHVADASTFEPATPVDHILLDAPCSATGTLRRNPDVLWSKKPDDVAKLSAVQAKILDHAFTLLPEGGRMVYCVCSLEPQEGQNQITAFLARTPKAKLIAIQTDEVGGMSDLLTPEGHLLCLPSLYADQGGMDGFFAARLTKTS